MYGKKQKDVKIQEKGITLIALIITIIVLIILAGVTIASLTGSDSAPAKANEAKQKNDIGAAKDDVSLTVQNALTDAYVSAYVDGNSSKGSASTDVGDYVITTVKAKYDAKPQLGLATITVGTDGKITITTTDVTETGSINRVGGILTWDTTPSGGGGGNPPQVGVTIDSVTKTAIEEAIDEGNSPTVTISLGNTKTTDWDVNYFSDGYVMEESDYTYDTNYYNTTKTLFNGTIPEDVSTSNTPAGVKTGNGSVYDSNGKEYIDCTISSWKILRINNDDTIDLVPAEVPERTVPLCGAQGYNNAVKLFNDACNTLYGNGSTITARSINIGDIEQLIEEEGNDSYLTSAKNSSNFGITKGPYSTSNSIYPTIYGNEMNDSLGLSSQTSYIERNSSKVTPNTGISPKQTYYYMDNSDLSTALGKYSSLILPGGSPSYWLASRCVVAYGDYCYFDVRRVGYGNLYNYYVFNSHDILDGDGYPLFPVVTVSSGILTDNGNGTYSID